MHAYATDGWESLFVTQAGVAAVLAGLLFVAVSINLARILHHPGLPGRAAETIVPLVGAGGLHPGAGTRPAPLLVSQIAASR